MMREDNLLCLGGANSWSRPTATMIGRRTEPGAEMALTGINPLWVADITHIRPEVEFVYLVGCWTLSRADRMGSGSNAGGRSGIRRATHGRSNAVRQRAAWCITPIAGFNMLRTTTPGCCRAAPHRNQHEPQGQPVRLKGLISRAPRTNRYFVAPYGLEGRPILLQTGGASLPAPPMAMLPANDAVLPFPLRKVLDRVGAQLDVLIYDAVPRRQVRT